ncbi:SulP family inorganic anion transporter [Gloeothece verrucosa]|uniref:Cyclic nucleotide-binding protein n=1 Tax=Gloeothece verrucosa (strain PCC 7822) TaxID=497965 RepID=E0ULF1_GLOV7|nr:SulP family inorganic anion transporter [Gloeothece verrucosa]ADN17781.1 cyclic nucleotide-binding protein [Gloeothece verrucosa PCC 7822]
MTLSSMINELRYITNFPTHLSLNFRQIFLSLIMTLIVGVSEISICLSLAILLFGEKLPNYVPNGFSLLLLSGVIANIIVAFWSSSTNIVVVPQDVPIAIFTVISSNLMTHLPSGTTDQNLWLTVVTTMVLTTFLTAIFSGTLGLLKFGNLIRFIPYPVMGGFLAGSGWLLLKGSLGMMAGINFQGNDFFRLFEPNILSHWGAGAILSIMLFWLTRRFKHWLVIPGFLMAAIVGFYLVFLISHSSLEIAREQGWLLESLSQKVTLNLFNPLSITQANWSLILGESGNICSIILLSTVGLLLNASAIELATKRDINLHQELRAVGLANLLTSFAGGFICYHQLNYSMLAQKLTINSRLVGLFTAGAYGMALVFGESIIYLFPKPVLGGLLLFLGFELLSQWLYDTWFKLPFTDYITIVIILMVIAMVGFLPGVAVGLLVTLMLFVVNYSRINIVKHQFSGVTHQSNVAYAPDKVKILKEKGEEILILELEGFIFFGTANNLVEVIQARIEDISKNPLRFLVLDFREVRGIDSSANISFLKIQQIAQKNGSILVFTHLSEFLKSFLEKGDFIFDNSCQIFSDLDRGLEWCEEKTLEVNEYQEKVNYDLKQQLKDLGLNLEEISKFINYLKFLKVEREEVIFQKGDVSDGLYFLESGQISVVVSMANGQTKRLRTYKSGTIIGEMGLYQQANRSATVICNSSSNLYYLSTQNFQKMEQENSVLASKFHRFIVILLAERLRHRDVQLENLLS